jgi:hypothetical protein
MATPEDMERASELAFGLFQIPAAAWYGAQSAFTQTMPLTTQSYSNVYLVTQLYAFIAVCIYLILLIDAVIKMLRMTRLMMLGKLRPWGCVRKIMGFIEIRGDESTVHDDVMCINVPLTGFAAQIITMFLIDASVSVFLALWWICWLPWVLVMMIVTFRRPKAYYPHLQSIRGHYGGVPRVDKDGEKGSDPSFAKEDGEHEEDEDWEESGSLLRQDIDELKTDLREINDVLGEMSLGPKATDDES